MTVVRVPILEERAKPEECFDTIIKLLVDENPAKTQCIFSSQLGRGRTTFGKFQLQFTAEKSEMLTDFYEWKKLENLMEA